MTGNWRSSRMARWARIFCSSIMFCWCALRYPFDTGPCDQQKPLGAFKLPTIFGVTRQKSRFQFIGESLAGCWVVALLGFSGYVLHFNSAPVGFLFLLVVVSEAILCGFWQATVVSILACACLDYFFYPPFLTFNMWDPQDWVALGAFEISALVVSRVSSREQRSSREAVLQRTAMEHLYE